MNLIAGNWKMNLNVSESLELANTLTKIPPKNDREVLVCPPFTSLALVADAVKKSHLKLGAQNMHFEDNGAFTGEVSADMLRDLEVEYVILGHSERRALFHEKNKDINKKVKKALEAGLQPILCVGENLKDREAGKEQSVVQKQFSQSLKGVKQPVVVAYEPVWAIGTGKTASPQQAQEMHAFLRKLCEKQFGKTRILYGGSVKPENVDALMKEKDIDGCLVGGASINADQFTRIINYNS